MISSTGVAILDFLSKTIGFQHPFAHSVSIWVRYGHHYSASRSFMSSNRATVQKQTHPIRKFWWADNDSLKKPRQSQPKKRGFSGYDGYNPSPSHIRENFEFEFLRDLPDPFGHLGDLPLLPALHRIDLWGRIAINLYPRILWFIWALWRPCFWVNNYPPYSALKRVIHVFLSCYKPAYVITHPHIHGKFS